MIDKPHVETIVLYSDRDPTEKDVNILSIYWISKEYVPHRVFIGEKGNWTFIGKFYPENHKVED